MLRYQQISEIRKTSKGKSYYGSLRYPVIEPKDSDVYLYTKRLMRLDLLAYHYYGDVTMWTIIARANNLGKGVLFLQPGIRIRIPYPLSESEVIEAFYDVNEKS